MHLSEYCRSAHSSSTDPETAVREFHDGVMQEQMELVLFFCSSQYPLDRIAAAINTLFPGVRVVGCTTAGEIGMQGYTEHSFTGVSFRSGGFHAQTTLIPDLTTMSVQQGMSIVYTLQGGLTPEAPDSEARHRFAFLLIDGLSMREELVARALQNALGKIPLVGGSAGDDLAFVDTWLFYDGIFQNNCAVLTLIDTCFETTAFKTQHFIAGEQRLVVTRADASRRLVSEINGRVAAVEYARLIGVPVDYLGPSHFAEHPVAVLIDGTEYVRSIQKMELDGGLTFYCAIDEGVVLRLVGGVNLVENLRNTFSALSKGIGTPGLVLGCDCILRNLEIGQRALKREVSAIFREFNTVGFSTYGEQFNGIHVNQTFTGIAIGQAQGVTDD